MAKKTFIIYGQIIDPYQTMIQFIKVVSLHRPRIYFHLLFVGIWK